jgi:hypothetical protein
MFVVARPIQFQYRDPVELVWEAALAKLGVQLLRSADAYASWDGVSTLTLARAEDFDADDSLAQLIFHELCHMLVAGERGKRLFDWGLDNTSERHLVFEHACHRVQAALATPMACASSWLSPPSGARTGTRCRRIR